jgi:cytochrome c553
MEIVMKKKLLLFCAGCALVFSGASLAGNAEAGKSKSSICGGCHGANGISSSPTIPNLAGQKNDYLVKNIKDFRAGKRHDPMMETLVKSLSDADIDDLAAFYSGLK